MIELIALYFLCKSNGEIAQSKGLPPNKWKAYTIFAWIVMEFIGLIFGVAMFGKTDLYVLFGIALFSAFGGYLFVRHTLEQKEGNINDIDKIGVEDLQPPKKSK